MLSAFRCRLPTMTIPLPPSLRNDDLLIREPADARTLPAHWYNDPAFHQADQDGLLARHWQLVGHASSLPDIGSHLVATVAGKPILVVRNNANALQAFYNVCQHRAGPLARANGCSRNLVCKYHGWTYSLEGQLLRAPEMQGCEQFNTDDIHLQPIHVTEWQGLVFVALHAPLVGIDTLFANVTEQIAPIDLRTLHFETRVVYEVRCNWKVYVDNYLEGYHLPLVHPGLSKVLDYRNYQNELYDWYSCQRSPIDASGGPYASGTAHYYFVHPNMMLNILPNRLQTNIVLPVAHDRCEVVFDYYYGDRESAATQKLIADDLQFANEVQQEDIEICERVQEGLQSGAYHAGRLSMKRESGVKHFHDLLRRSFAALQTV